MVNAHTSTKAQVEQAGGGNPFSRLFRRKRTSKAANLSMGNAEMQQNTHAIAQAQRNLNTHKARLTATQKTLAGIWKDVDDIKEKVNRKARIISDKGLSTNCSEQLDTKTAELDTITAEASKLKADVAKCESDFENLEKDFKDKKAVYLAYTNETGEGGKLKEKYYKLQADLRDLDANTKRLEKELASMNNRPAPVIQNIFDLPHDVRDYEALKEQVDMLKGQVGMFKRLARIKK
jgi:chromosome segregation ATPase